MSERTVRDAVYQPALLQLAADVTHAGPLPDPRITVTRRNARCGDTCTLYVREAGDGRVEALAHEVQACVLVQASAALIARHGHGLDARSLADLRTAVDAMLSGGPPPPAPWSAFAALSAAAGLPARHACVLLPLDALAEALATARPAHRCSDRSTD